MSKNTFFILLVSTLALSACAPALLTPTVEQQSIVTQPAATAQPTTSVTERPTFESATYVDELGRFEIDYPTQWTLNSAQGGSRGSYVQITSWDPGAAGLTEIPEGESLLQIAVYLWDPKHDLAARLEMRRQAWLASGNLILEESPISYEGDHNGVRLVLQDTAGNETIVVLLELGEDYLELTGIGDLPLLDEVMRTFRFHS